MIFILAQILKIKAMPAVLFKGAISLITYWSRRGGMSRQLVDLQQGDLGCGQFCRLILGLNKNQMKLRKNFKRLWFLCVSAACLAASLEAGVDELLNTLVKKGYLTEEEAAQIAGEDQVPVLRASGHSVQSLTISGYLHLQYDHVSLDDKGPSANPAAVSQFLLRQIRLGVRADLGNGWSGFINTDFSNNNLSLSDAIIAKKFDGLGTGIVGYQKVTFGYEENLPSTVLKMVEFSPATHYWSSGFNSQTLGFNSRHVGVFWKGHVPKVKGLNYGLAVVNGHQGGSFNNLGVNNNIGCYWNVAYAGSTGDLKYKVAFNMGYQPELRNVAGGIGGETWGWNPYVVLNYKGASLTAEMLGASIKDGKGVGGSGGTATPVGINVIPAYMVTDQWEIVFRYSHLRTNGRGVMPSQIVRNSQDPLINSVFNVVDSFYVGGNWFIRGNDVKLTAGYEYTHFSDRGPGFSNKDGVDDNVIRVRLQLVF